MIANISAGVIANFIFAIIIPFLIFGLGVFWWFRKKYQYAIHVPAKETRGWFDIARFSSFAFARSCLSSTETGKNTEMYFKYIGIRKCNQYFFYWWGDKGNGFCIIQKCVKDNYKFEGKNLFFEKKIEDDSYKMTAVDFFLSEK